MEHVTPAPRGGPGGSAIAARTAGIVQAGPTAVSVSSWAKPDLVRCRDGGKPDVPLARGIRPTAPGPERDERTAHVEVRHAAPDSSSRGLHTAPGPAPHAGIAGPSRTK